jgi:PAT family beta-lactamase induction signal transducer AmpG
MLIGGVLTDLFGKIRMMSFYLAGLILIVGVFCYFNDLWVKDEFIIGFIIAFYILLTFNNIALYASAMKLCSKNISATQFTLYMALANLGIAAGSGLIGPLNEMFGWEYVLGAFIPIILITSVLIRFIDFDRHDQRLKELDV